jgi:glycosyltransferase involved in cell wall biosynthesis
MISIVIPTLNEQRCIGRLLDSIGAQTIQEDIEIIVADAHSTDETRAVARMYREKFSRLAIVDGGPPPVGRNRGARASSGDPILFIDADVTLPRSDFLEVTVDYFRDHGLAAGATPLVPESDRTFDHILMGATNVFLRATQHVRPFGAICIVVRRDVFMQTGGYPEDRLPSEDHDFVRLCARYGQYDILPIPVHFSMRRFDKEGRARLIGKYAYALFYRTFVGPITKPIVKYDFAHKKSTKNSLNQSESS